ncbi:hypothetical protein cypCar_00017741 [Cyprinus carpio]|nr:hypothetical protein cypCar_00017741 [Cyprinus carpio]
MFVCLLMKNYGAVASYQISQCFRGFPAVTCLCKSLLRLFGSIEGEYVPVEGDEVTYKVCPVPPKNVKVQAMEVIITHLRAGTKHETWSGQIIRS